MSPPFDSQRYNFSIGIYDVKPHDWFEDRELELYVGLLP